MSPSVYQYPRYYSIGYRWNTKSECDFLQESVAASSKSGGKTVLDIGCGAGRHLMELARRLHRHRL
jgi:tRNA G46 methylase TrmB